jgi:NAD(P)-dependent dehydrogenase (short-subunit alcohol dehydrogenase family)
VTNHRPTTGLVGRVAIVTGASRGIGAAVARSFAEQGARLVLAARDSTRLEAVAEGIRRTGGEAIPVVTDVTDPASIEAAVQQAVIHFGRLDIAFNNAGATHRPAPLADLTIGDFETAIAVNLVGVFLSMRSEIPAMLEVGRGAIVNMASAAGLGGVPGLAGYAAAKRGVIGLTQVAALDYGRRGIRVNAIAPGPVRTERLDQLTEEQRASIAGRLALDRLATPEDVARLVLWLSSADAEFLTGAAIPIDGGLLAGAARLS